MESGPPKPASVPDFIEYDRYCVQCGYSLVGLDRSGACPECGTSIARSLQRTFASSLNRGARTALRDGADALMTAVFLQALAFCVVPLVDLGALLWAWGAWRCASPRVAVAAAGELAASARRTRAAAVLLGACTLLVGTATLLSDPISSALAGAPRAVSLLAIAGALALQGAFLWACAASVSRHLERLARELPNPRIAAGFARCRLLAPLLGMGLFGSHSLLWVFAPARLGSIGPALAFVAIAWLGAIQYASTLSRWRMALAEEL